MDWLAFIASLVNSLAWPAAALVVALVFRQTLKTVLGRPLRRVKAGPLEAEWEEKAAEAFADVAKSPETAVLPPPNRDLLSHRLRSVTSDSPKSAVLSGFAEIERVLRARLVGAGYEDAGALASARILAEVALDRGVISAETRDAIAGAMVLRNLAVHGPEGEPDTAKAADFLNLADGIIYAIEAGARAPE